MPMSPTGFYVNTLANRLVLRFWPSPPPARYFDILQLPQDRSAVMSDVIADPDDLRTSREKTPSGSSPPREYRGGDQEGLQARSRRSGR